MKDLHYYFLLALVLTTHIVFSQHHYDMMKSFKEIQVTSPHDEDEFYHMINVSHDLIDADVQSGSRLSPDGKSLYFFVNNDVTQGSAMGGQDIMVSFKDDEAGWTEASYIHELNNRDHNGVHYVSPKHDKVLLLSEYLANGTSINGVSIAHRDEKGNWKDPKPLKIKGYHNKEVCSFYLNKNEDVLFLAIKHKDTYGGQDIYVSYKRGKKWSKPINLGPQINTAAKEGAMSLSEDETIMYFSSNVSRSDAFGGFDIYMSKRLDSTWTNWSDPVNIGFPYNTPYDELYFTTSENDDYDYLSRHFYGPDSSDHSDIIAIKKHRIEKNIEFVVMAFDSETQTELEAKVKIVEPSSGAEANINAFELHTVENPNHYEVLVEADGYVSEKKHIYIDSDEELNVHLSFLNPKKHGVTWEIENVFFAFDDSELLEESAPALNNIVEILTREEGMRIEIAGHTDARGNDDYNLNLSAARAASVVSYLVEAGISKDRLEFKGYGEQLLVNNCSNGIECSEEQHQDNRRVELKILDVTP